MSPNSSESYREAANDNNSPNHNKYSKLMRDYMRKKLSQKESRLSFMNELEGIDSLSSDQLQDIKNFAGSTSEYDGLEISLENISLAALKREAANFLTGIQSKKVAIREAFLIDYDIESIKYTKYLASKVDDIENEAELEKLLDSSERRHEFMMEHVPNNEVPFKKIFSGVLQDIDMNQKLSQITQEHHKRAFEGVIHKFTTRQKFELGDVITLFEVGVFNEKEKQAIIESYMPSISLQDALDLGVFDIDTANNVKKEALKKSLDMGLFTSLDIESYISQIDNKEVLISTQGLFASAASQSALFEKNLFFQKFQSDFNNLIEGIEKKLAEESVQNADEMKQNLTGFPQIKGIEKFKSGATLAVTQKVINPETKQLEELTMYAEVADTNSAGTFTLLERGAGKYDNRFSTSSRQTYSQFIDFATKPDENGNIPEVEVISAEILRSKIQSGEIQDKNGIQRFESKLSIDSDLKSISEQIEERKKELRENKIPKSKWDEDEELQSLYSLRDQRESDRNNVVGNNKNILSEKIDELDDKGKDYGVEAGTTFVTKGGEGDVFSVQNVNEHLQQVVVRGLKKDETLTYEEFIQQFEQQKATRVSKINDFSELFGSGDDVYKKWGEFELKNNAIQKKGSKTKVDFDYLVPSKSSKNQELIQIEEIDGAMVTIRFGEAKSKKVADKSDPKKKDESKSIDVFSTEKQTYRVSVGVLDDYIRRNKLELRSLEEGKVEQEALDNVPKPKSKFGFANWFFQGMSISAAISGSKTAIEQITNMLNEGDEEKANAFALKVFGPFLGKNGKTDLQSRLEQTQRKNMDEMLERLKVIHSGPATNMIEEWLLDPRTPEYMKEAGMFYMFEKYGALCAKGLYKYQGEYFWYQKMGGIIGDKVWVETHEKNNREPKQNTTEEQLVYNLMAEQVKAGGFNGIQRRSKLAKELKAKRGQGKEEEYDTGVKDGSNERSIQDRLDGGLSELSSGNYPNAFGWQETIENKGGSMKQLNMIPFVTMFSGMAYNFEKDIVDKIKNGSGDSRLLMMKNFISYPGDIDLVNDTIMEICKNLDNDPKYEGILKKAESIYKNKKNLGGERDRQKETIKFYEEYGEVLTNVLYMLNTGDADDVHNKMIFFEKDDNSVFKRYYDKLSAISSTADTSFSKNEGLMADAFAGAGTSGINIYKATKELLEKGNEGTWRKHDAGPIMWKEIVKEFKAIPRRKYSDDPTENRKMQKKLLEYNLRSFMGAVMGSYTTLRATGSFNSPIGAHTELNTWGVYFEDLLDDQANASSVKEGGNKVIIEKFVNNIIDSELNGSDFTRPVKADGKGGFEYIKEGENPESDIPTVGDLISGETQRIISEPANDNAPPMQ